MAHLGLEKSHNVLELHIWVYLHRKGVVVLRDKRDLHGLESLQVPLRV